MKRSFINYIIAFSLFFSTTAIFAATTYQLDPLHSFVQWNISHLGFSNQTGKWLAEGSLVLDEAKPQNSKVNATIHLNNFITGISDLDKHLMEPMFFDIEKFPTATFVSDKVTTIGKNKAKVYGMLTLRGVSKPVVLDVVLNKMGQNPISKKDTVGFSAKAIVKRSDFGMTAFLPALGDTVDLNIQAEATRS